MKLSKHLASLVALSGIMVLAMVAAAEQDATITLGTDPEPPESVENPGGTVTIFWEIAHATTPDSVCFAIEDPTRTITVEQETYPGDTGLVVTRDWTVPEGLEDGTYWACVAYWSAEIGLEAYAEVGFLVLTVPSSGDIRTWARIKALFCD